MPRTWHPTNGMLGTINAAGASEVWIVGSASEVSAAVEASVRALPGVKTVKRVQAATPSARAVECAKALGKGRSGTVIVATQRSFKDALSISPYAYATKSPVLYVEESDLLLSKDALAFIKSAGFKRAIVVGGPIAIPESLEGQLASAGIPRASVARLAGSNSYRTSRVVA